GSGIIPIVLKKHFHNALVCAVDFSVDALAVAKKNASFHQVDIIFEHADYLKQNLSSQYDIIISNPPYIGQNEKSEIEAAVQNFEP
ncbi:methyltransferase, partial [Salmonella sp. ZJHZ19_0057]|uniref:methyltransferase n=1 Tax=Salmonella sp. ZJHZ19_0057 TaxID=3159585 RepID=UPI00397D2BCB